MLEKIKKHIFQITNASQVLEVQTIQELWSGYGELNRVILDNGSIIIKQIRFPNEIQHPRGWGTNIGHKRKVQSYQVEMCWYKDYNSKNEFAYSPKCLASGLLDGTQFFLLEDLGRHGFKPISSISNKQVEISLKWLANFHASYLNSKTYGLWDIGTYWNLETRPDEYNSMKDQNLKGAAYLIDKKLNSSKYKTIVHGDAKMANFLYQDQTACCAVDYQYVGGGVGIKDVIYFLSSIYNSKELFQNEASCLNIYFTELVNALKKNHHQTLCLEVEKEWRELYIFAWADFVRFLNGWSPDHYKIHPYSKEQTQKALNEVK